MRAPSLSQNLGAQMADTFLDNSTAPCKRWTVKAEVEKCASTEPKPLTDGRQKRADDKRERTRQSIIDTALNLIAQQGVDATSVLEVTNALGISNGAFYYHFRSKEQLLESVGHTVVEKLIELIESVTDPDPAANVARGPIVAVRRFFNDAQLRSIVMRVVIDEDDSHQGLHDRLREHVARGKAIGRFPIADVGQAVTFARYIMAGALREFSPGCDTAKLGKLAAAHTLAMLGLPMWEAHLIAERECARVDAMS
jgi:AcrR family transcriptional regulator